MRKSTCFLMFVLLFNNACKKNSSSTAFPPLPDSSFTTYTILEGEHYPIGFDSTHFELFINTHQHFRAIFDSTAIYKTSIFNNQLDVNKLFGFSDNAASHHAYSARVGWSWNDNALRLYGYTYNDSIRTIKQLAIVPIGKQIDCDIAVDTAHKQYLFTINGHTTPMPRLARTSKIFGYKLYPFFGGDEVAPHIVKIKVAEIP